jgi:hypothetical protein
MGQCFSNQNEYNKLSEEKTNTLAQCCQCVQDCKPIGDCCQIVELCVFMCPVK